MRSVIAIVALGLMLGGCVSPYQIHQNVNRVGADAGDVADFFRHVVKGMECNSEAHSHPFKNWNGQWVYPKANVTERDCDYWLK